MHFVYDKNNGLVAFYGTGENQFDQHKFSDIELEVSDKDRELMRNGYTILIKENKLVLEKSYGVLDKEKKELQHQMLKELREIVKKPIVNPADTKSALEKLITFLE